MKKQMTVFLEQGEIKWLEDKVREGKFKSISEGIRRCVEAVHGGLEALEAGVEVCKSLESKNRRHKTS